MNRLMCVPLGLMLCIAATGCGKVSPEKQMQAAQAALNAGRIEEARETLVAALEAAPEAPFAAEAWNWLGLANHALGRTNEAVAAFDEAIRLAPASFLPVYNAGSLALETGDMSHGMKLLRQAADLDPRDTKALLRIGEWTTRNTDRWDLAKRMYYEVQKRDPRNAAAATGLGRIALLEGQLPQAETFFMNALEMDKNYPPALYNLGVLHSEADGLTEEAEEYFRQYLAVAPQGIRVASASERLSGGTPASTAFRAHAPSGPDQQVGIQWAQALSALEKGDTETAYTCILRALEAARNGGNLPQRAEIITRALESFGDRSAIQLEAGEYYLDCDNPRAALEALTRAQALDPENPLVLLKLARAAAAVEEFDTAVLSLRHLVKLEPANADAQWELAALYGDKLGMTSKGIAAYLEFETRFPSDPRAADVAARVKSLEAEAAAFAAELDSQS